VASWRSPEKASVTWGKRQLSWRSQEKGSPWRRAGGRVASLPGKGRPWRRAGGRVLSWRSQEKASARELSVTGRPWTARGPSSHSTGSAEHLRYAPEIATALPRGKESALFFHEEASCCAKSAREESFSSGSDAGFHDTVSYCRGVLRQGQTELARLEKYLPTSRFAPFFLHSSCNNMI
jgi:hypothetical protein